MLHNHNVNTSSAPGVQLPLIPSTEIALCIFTALHGPLSDRSRNPERRICRGSNSGSSNNFLDSDFIFDQQGKGMKKSIIKVFSLLIKVILLRLLRLSVEHITLRNYKKTKVSSTNSIVSSINLWLGSSKCHPVTFSIQSLAPGWSSSPHSPCFLLYFGNSRWDFNLVTSVALRGIMKLCLACLLNHSDLKSTFTIK